MIGPDILEPYGRYQHEHQSENENAAVESPESPSPSHPKKFVSWIASKFTPGSIKGSIFELIGVTMGAGVLLIPYSFSKAGLGFGVFQLILCAALSYYSAILLAKSADLCLKYNYFEVASATFGKYFQLLVKLVMFINNWGGCIIYTILITDFIATSLGIFFPNHELPSFLTDSQSLFWPPVFTTLVVLPLSLHRDLSGLRFTSLLGFLFILYLAGVVIYASFSLSNFSFNISHVSEFNFRGIGVAFPIAIFSYSYHPNVLYVYDELQRPSFRRISKVLFRSVAAACAVFTIIGVFGYIAFADNLDALSIPRNILFSFQYKGWPTQAVVSLLLIGVTIILLMPLTIKPAKEALGELIFNTSLSSNEESKESLLEDGQILRRKESRMRHVILVIATVYSQMLVGMFLQSMSVIIQILGASTVSLMCFNFPCLFYLKLNKDAWHAPNRLFAHFVNILMIFIGIYSLYVTLEDL